MEEKEKICKVAQYRLTLQKQFLDNGLQNKGNNIVLYKQATTVLQHNNIVFSSDLDMVEQLFAELKEKIIERIKKDGELK